MLTLDFIVNASFRMKLQNGKSNSSHELSKILNPKSFTKYDENG